MWELGWLHWRKGELGRLEGRRAPQPRGGTKLGRRKRCPGRGGGQIEAGGAGLEYIRVKETNMIENKYHPITSCR